MRKVLSVYNICGLRNENVAYYINALDSILRQDLSDCDVVISSCMAKPQTRELLLKTYSGLLSFCFVEEILPVNVTFNHTVRETVKKYSEYEAYFYVDSGVTLEGQRTVLSDLYQVFKSGPYAMVSAMADTDMGFDLWADSIGSQLEDDTLVTIPVGSALNNHAQLFSNSLLRAYNGLIPTCFASYCTESVYSFLCAAIKEKWVLCKNIKVHHTANMDGQSSGFSPDLWKAQGKNISDHPFRIPSIIEMMKRGYEYGMGYEEWQPVLMHDKEQFDENGFCKNDKLKDFIRDNVFISKEFLDYDTIKCSYVWK